MDVQSKKALLGKLLGSKKHGEHKRLARFCGVQPHVVSYWLNSEKSWTSKERERQIASYFGADPAIFSGEKAPDLSSLPSSRVVVEEAESLPLEAKRPPPHHPASAETKGDSLRGAVDNLPSYADMLDWAKAAREQALPTMNEVLRPKVDAIFTHLSTLLQEALTPSVEAQSSSRHTEEIVWLDGTLLEFERGIKALRDLQSERGLHVLAYIHRGLEKHLRCLTHVGVWPPGT